MLLILSPQRLHTDHQILESYHQVKVPGRTDYFTSQLNATEVRKYFSALPKEIRDLLVSFGREKLQPKKEEIRKSCALKSNGQSTEEYYDQSMLRLMYDKLSAIRSCHARFRWFHKIEREKGRFAIGPCAFNMARPQLFFEVICDNDVFHAMPVFHINGARLGKNHFRRYAYLLETANEYFLLAYKDFQLLDWLRKNEAHHAAAPEAFAAHVLSKLEPDYQVERNGYFKGNEITVKPNRRVMLNEINNAFLMLTPQFVYDGHVQESPYKELVEISSQGELVCVRRDKVEEEAFISYLQSLHPNFNRQLNGVFHLSFAEAQKKQWFFKVYHRFLEADIEIVGMDMLRHFRYSPHQVATTVNMVEEQDNMMLIDIDVKFGKETVAIHDLQKMLLAGQRAVLLKDDSLGILTDEWLQRYGTIVRHGKVQNKRIRVSKWIALSGQQEEQTSSGIALVDKTEWWNRLKLWQETTDILYPLPSVIKIDTLRPYQQKGYEWMRLLAEAGAGACLADDMGLGKTIQAICFLAYRAEQHPQARHLVVSPTSLIYNWKQELEKFAPGIAALVFHGAQRDDKSLSDEKVKIILTSYGTIRSDIGLFAAHRFDTVVIDESHNIKNPDALITKAVNQLQASTRITLSGTPIMNNTFDIYSQVNFILPDFLGSKEFFRKQYADPIDRDRDEAKIKALQKLTSLFILRRTKEQVATDLPPKTETILWCAMKGEQRDAYDAIKESIRSSLFLQVKQKGVAANKLSILTGLMKLRQICNSTELVPDDQLNSRESVKTEVLLDELKSITKNHKVLVFSQFTKMLDILEREVSKQQLSYLRLDGSTGSEQRQELVNRFNDEYGDEKLFLLSLKAGNAGLNLTAADYVFLFDPWWSPAVEQQAIDRTHRIGQTRKVFAYKMICKDTIEERIVELQHRKKTLSHELIGAEEGFLNQLSEDDLEYLFS